MPSWVIIKRFLSQLWIVRQYFSSSNIPQFILDTQHPWIEENRFVLSGVDAREALCNSTSALRAGLPHIPHDLLKYLEIDNNRASAGERLGWHNAEARVQEILNCSVALESCEHLNLQIYVHNSKYDDLWEPLEPPDTLPELFKDMLGSMPNLTSLEWEISSGDLISFSKFNATFAAHPPLRLDAVKRMTIEAHMDALVLAAPNLQTLEISGRHKAWPAGKPDPLDPWRAMIKAVSKKPHLKSFSMTSEWFPEMAETILSALPQLETLTMGGSMGYYWIDDETNTFKDVLSVVNNFKSLTHLALPDSHDLRLGFDGGPWCGNAYFGADGTKYGRQVTMQSMEADEKAAALVLEAIPHIKSFAIGGTHVQPERIDNGEVVLRWPWTGRVREYLLEMWPRYTGGDGIEYGGMEDPNGPVLSNWEEDESVFAGDVEEGNPTTAV